MTQGLPAAMLAAFAISAAAQDPAAEQPTVVVTATRSATPIDQSLASVSVITREDIVRSQAPDLLQLLRTLPGIDISRTGGVGQNTSFLLRGTNSNQSLVLIDGVRAASTGTGAYAWEHLPLDQIERIEVVRGPRAAWWGADAIGGVIQVFTREPQGLSARARAGRYATVEGSLGYGTRGEDWGLAATVGGISSNGFSAQTPEGFAYDPDADGYIDRNVSLHGHARLGTQTLRASVFGTNADTEFDQGESDAEQWIASAGIAGPLADRWAHALTLGATRDDLVTPAYASEFQTRRASADWVNTVSLGDAGEIAAGLNYLDETGRSLITIDGVPPEFDRSRSNRAAFASWQAGFGAFDAQLAGRYDDNSAYGGESTFQVAAGWRLAAAWRLYASWGEGFRAPTLSELYSPGFGGYYGGNPDLAPERSHGTELGIEGTFAGTHTVGASLYGTRIRDLVSFSGGDTFAATNIGNADLDGLELRYGWEGGAWRLDANATLQDTEDRATGEALLRRPEQKASVEVTHRLGASVEATLGGDFASSRRDFGAELPGYALFNARMAWTPDPAWRLGLRLDNALDRDYALAYGYGTPGRSLLLTVDYLAP